MEADAAVAVEGAVVEVAVPRGPVEDFPPQEDLVQLARRRAVDLRRRERHVPLPQVRARGRAQAVAKRQPLGPVLAHRVKALQPDSARRPAEEQQRSLLGAVQHLVS